MPSTPNALNLFLKDPPTTNGGDKYLRANRSSPASKDLVAMALARHTYLTIIANTPKLQAGSINTRAEAVQGTDWTVLASTDQLRKDQSNPTLYNDLNTPNGKAYDAVAYYNTKTGEVCIVNLGAWDKAKVDLATQTGLSKENSPDSEFLNASGDFLDVVVQKAKTNNLADSSGKVNLDIAGDSYGAEASLVQAGRALQRSDVKLGNVDVTSPDIDSKTLNAYFDANGLSASAVEGKTSFYYGKYDPMLYIDRGANAAYGQLHELEQISSGLNRMGIPLVSEQ